MGEVCKERKLRQQRRSCGSTTNLRRSNSRRGVVLRQRRRGRCSFSGETVPTSQIIEPAGGQTFIAISPRREAEPIIKTIRANVASLITRVTQPINVEKTMVSEATSLMPSRQFNFPSVNVQRQQAINWNVIPCNWADRCTYFPLLRPSLQGSEDSISILESNSLINECCHPSSGSNVVFLIQYPMGSGAW